MYVTASTWGKNTFILHFFCEHDPVHFTEHCGYAVSDPNTFLRQVGPVISFVSRIAVSTMLTLTGSQTPLWFQSWSEKFGRRPTEYLNSLSAMLDQVHGLSESNYEQLVPELRGPALREIEGKLSVFG